MSEQAENADSGAAAMDIALDQARNDPALAATVENYLNRQIKLSELQEHHMRLRHVSDLGRMAFHATLGFLALALVAGISLMVWNAAHAEGLIIESFSVPPDMAGKGIDGQVAASQLLDKLTVIQNLSTSVRPAKSYANAWGDDLKVEIPETGVSIGEAYRFLRNWLGHETHVRGEIIRTDIGIVITTRIGNTAGASFAGPESDLDALMHKSAEQIYRVIQPDRYARYLFFPRPGLVPRYNEARAVLTQQLAESGPAERGWAWTGLGVLASVQGHYKEAVSASHNAIAENPDIAIPYSNLAGTETLLSHPEGAISAARKAAEMMSQGPRSDIIAAYAAGLEARSRFLVAIWLGDYLAAAEFSKRQMVLRVPSATTNLESIRNDTGQVASLLHDGAAVRAWRIGLQMPEGPGDRLRRSITQLKTASGLQDWRAVFVSAGQVEKEAYSLRSTILTVGPLIETGLHPVMALAKARLGDVEGAQRLIATTPGDCYDCARTRGIVAAAGKQWGRAEYWFARAIHDAPSIPFAYADWGQTLLERGQPDAAIAKFALANQKGPHFADALEGWGETLMAKNQSHRALEKFAEAEKYAPNWGRLHLKWGEALAYSGKPDEAKAQFARASSLDLTPSEKSELTTLSANRI